MSDYIERGALMDKIGERLAYLRKENGDYDHYTDGYEECYYRVEEAPAADVAPIKHGVWEKTGYAYLLRCSACHDCYIDEDWLDGKKWNFCPECGAKMGGGDDSAFEDRADCKRELEDGQLGRSGGVCRVRRGTGGDRR